MTPITVHVTYDVTDVLEADRLYYAGSRRRTVHRLIGWLFVAIGCWRVAGAGISWASLAWFGFTTLMWWGVPLIDQTALRIIFARNPRSRDPHDVTFADDGLHFKTPSVDARVAWSHYTRAAENGRVIVLIYGWRAYTVIPKRAFSDQRAFEAFQSLTRQKIPACVSR